ncbi:MAG: ATP-dependent helicase, partial [Treponemataceae bacterium]|nr:ATP-dependent helicase [Treponemataceae bacterium]
QNFSLISLPLASAEKVLQMAKDDRSRPHIHVDTQESGGADRGGDRGGRRGFGGGRRFGAGGGDRHFGRGDWDGKKSRGFRSDHGRANVHTPTERVGASAYKKANRKKNEF